MSLKKFIEENRVMGIGIPSLEFTEADEEYFDAMASLSEEYNFVHLTDKLKLNPEDIFKGIDYKKELIREVMGYTRLNGKGKEKVKLDECSDTKIGLAFQNMYNSYLNQLVRASRS